MIFDFDTPVNRGDTSSLKWDKYKRKDVLPMWVADMDFISPPAVIEALHARIDHGVFGYTLPPQELVDVLCSRMEQAYQWQIDPDWLVWLPGLVTGLNVACQAVGEVGDEVISMVPVYYPFLSAPSLSQRKLVTTPIVEQGQQWVIDFDALRDKASAKSKLLLFCNPQNPLGRVFREEELRELAQLCEEKDLVICSDEIHCDLILDPEKKHIPLASLSPEIAQRTITLMAPSKSFNLPGLGCSFAIIPNPKLRLRFQRAMQGIVPYVNTLGYTAALAAYQHGGDWLAALLPYLRDNRDLVQERIAQIPGLSMKGMEATYLAWIDTRELKLGNASRFFEMAGLGLSNGADFGGEGFVRLNFGCPRSQVQKALDIMAQAVEEYGYQNA
ncbi:MAG: aspartate aminotransferase [SAR324 cluster bacterium]|uniref:cysteine-S-conjugate beta-lyase n=1 Tax=SAR324 cluster bacterium TaxID=2024889 RepID=A0A2A4T186_9DELT|nr:MAG: aspartate aminotransferase [SAR324 cluster bacterium]